MTRQIVSSGSPLEPVIGFSRAVRIGNQIAVAGTAPIGTDGKTVGVNDAHQQATRCLGIIAQSLAEAGATMDDVIRTRIFLVNMADWEAVARAHGEIFSAIRPASTFMAVSGFINPEWLVEIEADAIIEQ
jgi:enamine deaminase RidA (YjgF/YER057c/UK114 family)